MTYLNIYIGQRIKTLREERGISARQVANALGVSLDSYRQCEVGRRRFPVSEIFAVRRLLNIPIAEFFTSDGLYISDLDNGLTGADISDLILYFSNINDSQKRQAFMEQIKDASSVF